MQTSLIFFYLGFTTLQDYLAYYEPSQSISGVNAQDLWEKPPDHPQAEYGLLCYSSLPRIKSLPHHYITKQGHIQLSYVQYI